MRGAQHPTPVLSVVVQKAAPVCAAPPPSLGAGSLRRDAPGSDCPLLLASLTQLRPALGPDELFVPPHPVTFIHPQPTQRESNRGHPELKKTVSRGGLKNDGKKKQGLSDWSRESRAVLLLRVPCHPSHTSSLHCSKPDTSRMASTQLASRSGGRCIWGLGLGLRSRAGAQRSLGAVCGGLQGP